MSKKSECLAWLIRRHGIEMTHLSGGSHIGSVLSAADIIAVLYADIMRYKSEDPEWYGRDRFIMSKGHAGAAVYAALAECGFFDTAELKTHYADGSRLSGHVSHHCREWSFQPVHLGMGCPLRRVWHWLQNRMASFTEFLQYWETGNAMKAPYGRLHCLPTITDSRT